MLQIGELFFIEYRFIPHLEIIKTPKNGIKFYLNEIKYFTILGQIKHPMKIVSLVVSAFLLLLAVIIMNGTKQNKNIIIIGGGLAGTCAAIEASKLTGSTIHLFEKEKKLGGNSAKASSGMNGCHTTIQKENNILDTKISFLQDTLKSGKGNSNETLVKVLVENSANSIEFLQSFGIKLNEISQCGGHSIPRTHRSKPSENLLILDMKL